MGPGFEPLRAYSPGEMAEWSIAPVLKTGVLRGTGGSNPSLSAHHATVKQHAEHFPPFYTRLMHSTSRVFSFLGEQNIILKKGQEAEYLCNK